MAGETSPGIPRGRRFRSVAMIGAALVAAALGLRATLTQAAEPAVVIPPPKLDAPPPRGGLETIVLAGGCFWGMQAVYEHTRGVTKAVSGYAGGDAKDAHYEIVSTGTTGHAESEQVTFDPRKISLGRILQIYFSVAHNPTELDYQGPDVGSQYRSEIFYANNEQKRVAVAYIAQLDKAHVFKAPIATKVAKLPHFYPAERYHQDFAVRHPDNAYIVYNDWPKVENLKRLFPHYYREQPVLVLASSRPVR